jgi:hypothetical protein
LGVAHFFQKGKMKNKVGDTQQIPVPSISVHFRTKAVESRAAAKQNVKLREIVNHGVDTIVRKEMLYSAHTGLMTGFNLNNRNLGLPNLNLYEA